jgi:hypothetical protein
VKHVCNRKSLIKRSDHLGIRDVTARWHGIETAKSPLGLPEIGKGKNLRQFFIFFSPANGKKCCRVGVKK